jgi:hypothetical protein
MRNDNDEPSQRAIRTYCESSFGEHELNNGILFRLDLHRLFDRRYFGLTLRRTTTLRPPARSQRGEINFGAAPLYPACKGTREV